MSHKCERKDRKDSHKESHKTCHKEKFETLDKLKVRDLCVKNLKVVDITTKTITGATGTFDNLVVNNATINNLNATTINGRNPDCDNSPFNFSGVITPVSYVNGTPQQPDNPGNFNQAVLDDLWNLNVLANAVTNLDADSGRLRNAILNNFYGCETCPAPNLSGCTGATGPFGCSNQGYSVFTGSIAVGATGATGTILTVTSVSNESLTDCPPTVRPIQVGQMVFLQDTNTSFPSSTIISQLTGTPGSTGTYLISNNFNDYSSVIPSQTMLALSNRTTNECVNVPLRIYGVETLSVGPTGPCGNIISAIAYNINIANKTLSTRVAAVYVQVGWQVPGATGGASVNIQGLSIDTKQFDPSILSFGEQMNNNVLLPTDLITSIAVYNNTLDGIVNAVVQLVVYVEDGLEVLIPESESASAVSPFVSSAARVTIQAVQGTTTNYSASYVPNSCFIPEIAGTVGPYIQPFIGGPIQVASNFSGNIFLIPGTTLFTPGGSYIIESITPLGFITLINTGYTGNTPPGTAIGSAPNQVNAQFQGFVAQTGVFSQPFNFTQPPVGSDITISGGTTSPIFVQTGCFDIGIDVIITTVSNTGIPTILGIYTVIAFDRSSLTLRNTGNPINVPPGTSYTGTFLVSLLSIVGPPRSGN